MKSVFWLCFLATGLSGCATITRGTTEQLQMTSNPSEARATTSLGYSCTTPCTMQVNRKDEFTVTFTKDGYESQDVPVKTQTAGGGAAAVAGNILIGGVIGAGTDVATGAALEHVPNPVHADLEPIKPPAPRAAKKPVKPAKQPAVGS